jgi:hypothetical protein
MGTTPAETEVLELGGISIYVLHDLPALDLKPKPPDSTL